ncbi:hypothetical protein HZH66_002017 [Vespula vulgaris]|uniref:Uncharacterized protein n=1 Tax=Vespula vulgaris TaxID=7454 RepID=A0A834NFU6_VESVU|nr:hypothetical protein HZH66_002017 [Vespula vulgaris]
MGQTLMAIPIEAHTPTGFAKGNPEYYSETDVILQHPFRNLNYSIKILEASHGRCYCMVQRARAQDDSIVNVGQSGPSKDSIVDNQCNSQCTRSKQAEV